MRIFRRDFIRFGSNRSSACGVWFMVGRPLRRAIETCAERACHLLEYAVRLRRGCFILCCCCCFSLGLFAQEDEAVRSFRVLGYGDSDFRGISVELEESADSEASAAVLLEFVPNRKSRALKIPDGQNRLEFFREKLAEGGKVVQEELGQVDWPKSAEKVLIVFLQSVGPDEDEAYEFLVLDESESVWGPRCVRLLNLSGVPLDARMAEHRFPVDKGPTEILRFEGEYSIPMTLELSLPWAGKRQIVYSARFVADQYSPKLLVVKPPREEGSMKVVVDTIW